MLSNGRLIELYLTATLPPPPPPAFIPIPPFAVIKPLPEKKASYQKLIQLQLLE